MTPATVLGWLAFALLVVSTLLWFRLAGQVRLPRNRSGFVLAWSGAALLGGLAIYAGAGWLAGIPAVLAVFAGGMLSILTAVSAQQAAPDAIAVGEPLRDFAALDEEGRRFELSSLRGRPILLKFFRGHW
ncbi:MAG: hypothetical protein JRG86_03040 [Deltaproteobacteria bacterium]|jgi:hypothetical protein|nr:hypothetical protein [Deltaproteobacteria bacterium]MBW2499605.1 hypothetical protein [Deltaproteobacteria bacterium]